MKCFSFKGIVNINNFKKLILLSILMIFFISNSFSQNEEKINKIQSITESGVVIYKSQGVENSQKTISSKEIILNDKIDEKISEWNSEKCSNVLYDLNKKISFLESINSPENEITGYRITKNEIIDRQRVLNNVNIIK